MKIIVSCSPTADFDTKNVSTYFVLFFAIKEIDIILILKNVKISLSRNYVVWGRVHVREWLQLTDV